MKISKFKGPKNLIRGCKNVSGRNKNGKLIITSKGGGHKKLYRLIDKINHKSIVLSQHYDPYRTSNIMLIKDLKNGNYKYIIAPTKIKPMTIIKPYGESSRQIGDVVKLKHLKAGQLIHCLENIPNKGPIFARSAGSFVQVLNKEPKNTVKVLLPSKIKKIIKDDCTASLGIVSTKQTYRDRLSKAGNSRWMNKRPHVRGVAMNPVDHPHGGGEGKTSGGRPSVTPKGWPAKGRPTKKNKIIIS